MLGAYFGYSFFAWTGNFWLALILIYALSVDARILPPSGRIEAVVGEAAQGIEKDLQALHGDEAAQEHQPGPSGDAACAIHGAPSRQAPGARPYSSA